MVRFVSGSYEPVTQMGAPLLVKGVQEQQAQIQEQEKEIVLQRNQIEREDIQMKQQQTEIEALKKLVCLDYPGADVCKQKDN